jgi:hypothetical protein
MLPLEEIAETVEIKEIAASPLATRETPCEAPISLISLISVISV